MPSFEAKLTGDQHTTLGRAKLPRAPRLEIPVFGGPGDAATALPGFAGFSLAIFRLGAFSTPLTSLQRAAGLALRCARGWRRQLHLERCAFTSRHHSVGGRYVAAQGDEEPYGLLVRHEPRGSSAGAKIA